MNRQTSSNDGTSSKLPSVISRRTVIASGAIVGGGVLGGALLLRDRGDTPPPPPPSIPTPDPTSDVAGLDLATPPRSTPTPVPSPEQIATEAPLSASELLVEASIADLRAALDSGEVTVEQLVQASLDRIAELDGGENGLAAFIETNPDALDIARQMDVELKAGQLRGPLHGIPVAVKDVFATGDHMKTAAGCLALAQNTVIEDSFVVGLLRNAGAVLMGKANMTEWSGFRSSGLASGWSARGGQARNPYMLDKSPWGSSSGSAIAVAASYVPLSMGAETDGSILCPASACGVVGMKPTVGLVSRTGVLPLSFSQDSPGPMARSVRDVAIMLSVVAGYDPEDPANGEYADSAPASRFESNPIGVPGSMDYTSSLNEFSLHGKRIGIARSLWGFDAGADATMETVISLLGRSGVEFVDNVELYMNATSDDEFVVLITEFPEGVQRFIDRFMPGGPVQSISDVVDYNNAHPDEELQYGDQIVLEQALQSGSIDDAFYRETLVSNHRSARDEAIDAIMDEAKIDVLIAPTTSVAAEINPGGDVGFNGASAQISAIAGYPAINLPIGLVGGLPVGMNIFGRAFSEQTLLEVAYGFEQILQARVAPSYLPPDPRDDPTEAPYVEPSYEPTTDENVDVDVDIPEPTDEEDPGDVVDGGL